VNQVLTLLLIYSNIFPMDKVHNKIDFALLICCHVVGMTRREIAELSVASLAEYMRMSVSSVYTHFEKEALVDMTPAEFLLKIKLVLAEREMIKNPYITVRELSRMLGFASERHFIRLFREIRGFTPGKLLFDLRHELKQKREYDRERKAKSRQLRKTLHQNH